MHYKLDCQVGTVSQDCQETTFYSRPRQYEDVIIVQGSIAEPHGHLQADLQWAC